MFRVQAVDQKSKGREEMHAEFIGSIVWFPYFLGHHRTITKPRRGKAE